MNDDKQPNTKIEIMEDDREIPPDELAIKALRTRSNAAITRRDVCEVVAAFHAKGCIFAADGQLMDGVAALRHYFAHSFQDPGFQGAQRSLVSVEVSGSNAAEMGSWEACWNGVSLRGKYLARLRKETEGWRVLAELYVPLLSDSA